MKARLSDINTILLIYKYYTYKKPQTQKQIFVDLTDCFVGLRFPGPIKWIKPGNLIPTQQSYKLALLNRGSFVFTHNRARHFKSIFLQQNVIKNQTTESLPFPFILSSATITFSWLVYGVILRNEIIFVSIACFIILFKSANTYMCIYHIYLNRHTHIALTRRETSE